VEVLDCESDVEMSTCWKLVGGGRLDEVSIEWRGGKRVEVDEAMPCNVAVSAATTDLRNGLDEAMMSTGAVPRVLRLSFFVFLCAIQAYHLRRGKVGEEL
jgi:hypothetical protein